MAWRDWVRTVEVEPSLYAADFARLGEQVETLLHAGARIFHFDVGDGHFVEPITMGPVVLRSIAPIVHAGGGTAAVAREHGLGVGLAFSPESDPAEVAARADGVDLVLCMSIHPGYSGQQFLPESLDRLRTVRAALPPEVYVQVDGGINDETIEPAHEAGADLLVAATAIFGRADLTRAFRRLVRALA